MAVKSTLRDRRRVQTSREIQRAALSLALRHGYDAVTTEMIAAEAGISQRTFFNYYLNKDAAIVGTAFGRRSVPNRPRRNAATTHQMAGSNDTRIPAPQIISAVR